MRIINLIIVMLFLDFTSLHALKLDYYPTKNWKTKSLKEAGINEVKFKKLLNYVWEEKGNHFSDSLVIIKDGYLVYEGYSKLRNFGPNKKHMFWSFSKSLTSTLMGIAMKKKILSWDSYAHDYFPKLDRNLGKDIQLKHILHMTSGFNYYEENPVNIALSDSIFYFYSKKAFQDIAESLSTRKMMNRPGSQFNYGTHQPVLAMGMLKKAINDKEKYDNFPWVELFDKLGMNSIVFEQDKSGTFLGGSGGWGTARDYAKFGLFMLNNGAWEGEQITPKWWTTFATKIISPALLAKQDEEKEGRLNREAYGLYWWLNKKLPMNKKRPYPSAPSDLYQAMGFRGQTMGIIPSRNLVVVRMGSDGRKPKNKLKRDKFYKLLLASFDDD